MTHPYLLYLLVHVFFDHIDKIIEQVAAVVRAGSAFGVVLNRESRLLFQPDTFNAVIIQVYVRNLNVFGFLHTFRINAKTMVLGGYFTFTC